MIAETNLRSFLSQLRSTVYHPRPSDKELAQDLETVLDHLDKLRIENMVLRDHLHGTGNSGL